jgi:hypothetical protein
VTSSGAWAYKLGEVQRAILASLADRQVRTTNQVVERSGKNRSW